MFKDDGIRNLNRNSFGLLFECIRKINGWNQTDISKMLNITQSKISKIESGNLELSAFEWATMAKCANISQDVLNRGYVDSKSNTVTRSFKREHHYLLPKEYRKLRCIKVRYLLPLLGFVEESVGEKQFNRYLLDNKMLPSFFYSLDNQVNMEFVSDLLSFLFKNSKIKERDMENISETSRYPIIHGDLRRPYFNSPDKLNLVKKFIGNTKKYHDIFDYDISEEGKEALSVKYSLVDEIKESFLDSDEHFVNFLEKTLCGDLEHLSHYKTIRNNGQQNLKIINKQGSFLYGDTSITYALKFV